ncbi:sigma-54-dependent Fis family transcriptional regulator [Pseudomonas sp. LRF_L74]|uniref:sigma-54-dependent Fis family transcriptional regulator n=1 Tax=Pseudomonas sp. LRF_L74 TaxID=3369422 RepID=UPI003F60A318
MNSAIDLQLIRRRFADDERLPAACHLPSELEQSWRRSRAAGLTPYSHRLASAPPSRQQIEQTQETHQPLIRHLAPEMQLLWQSLADSRWMVLCIEQSGLIVHGLSAEREAAFHGLRVGRRIHEGEIGTTAPSCVLQSARPCVIHGSQHYLSELDRFFCTATPIRHPDGQLLAVLDVTSVDQSPPLWLQERLNMAAVGIENRLYQELPGCSLLHVHYDPRLLGTPLEGILAIADDGSIRAANGVARGLLGLEREGPLPPGMSLQELLDGCKPRSLDRLRLFPEETVPLTLASGHALYARLHQPRVVAPPVPAFSAPRQAPAEHPLGADPDLLARFAMASRAFQGGVPILLQGETGVGKEVFSRALHDAFEPRRPFVAINCSAIPAELIESELFGYREGAFTGSRKGGAIGKIEQANGGTLFLDEIGDMPALLQTRLLRVLQERCLTRLGDNRTIALDLRLVSASLHPLEELIGQGGFREDLYYRINGLRVTLPALRERRDVAQLVQTLLRREVPDRPKRLSAEAQQAVLGYHWPGNVRQLQQALKVAAILSGEAVEIELGHFPPDLLQALRPTPASAHGGTLHALEREAIQQALRQHQGNMSATAKALGISRSTLYKKLQ